jgi:transketolase
MDKALEIDGPAYIRLARQATPVIYDENTTYNQALVHGDGNDLTIFATGTEVYQALEAKNIIESQDINGKKPRCRVVDMLSIKPIDKNIIVECAKQTNCLISVEDHNIIGGLGSAIAEVLIEEYPKKLNRIGINDTFTQSGKASELVKKYGLDAESIADRCIEILKKTL